MLVGYEKEITGAISRAKLDDAHGSLLACFLLAPLVLDFGALDSSTLLMLCVKRERHSKKEYIDRMRLIKNRELTHVKSASAN